MGYYCTTQKEGEKFDILSHDFLFVTDEEMYIAGMAFQSECDEILNQLKDGLPEDLAKNVYTRHLMFYIRYVQDWMNTRITPHDPDYRPTEIEDAARCLFSRSFLTSCIDDYQNGDVESLSKNEYFIYRLSDEDILEKRKKFKSRISRPSEEGLMPVGSAAYNLIDYERIVPVTITDRKGFLYYCEAKDGHTYIAPCHHLFPTEEEANGKITERNSRRDAAIAEYHLLEQSDNERLNQRRQKALEWLYFNQDPPELMIEELKAALG